MSDIKLPPEKLGSFFLGAEYDLKKKEINRNNTINYDARDLTTHAVCVGMTGSGKTGLCIGLLEEAALDKVPAIIIDPKGDMTNLLLQFENLSTEEFKSWVNEDDARRKGISLDEFAKNTADKWKEGLKSWGQDSRRIKALKDSVEYKIYTPGSNSGIPINILGSFNAPEGSFDEDAEILIERIQGITAALLGMINNNSDPTQSREGILIANIFEHYWRKNENIDLTKLILSIQNPPFNKLGVFDLESFFSQEDRFKLAIDFNTLVASPSFKYWLTGEDLDIDKLYFNAEGKPKHCVIYIAHLSENERMFFVTLLLNSLISWMRRQSGTSLLRSLIYFDEIFGYFPPTANPPSKKPLLTILKQARAFGVGAVLVTQNPVDIDYKGLSNAGTWFIGKLQTERDKMRVLDGLKGAIAEANSSQSQDFDHMISALDSRVFLLHNVHGDDPILFHTRWVMSYLRGPLTRPQIKLLQPKSKTTRSWTTDLKNGTKAIQSKDSHQATPPSLDPSISQKYFSIWKSGKEASEELNSSDPLKVVYHPDLVGIAKVRFYDARKQIDEIINYSFIAEAPDEFGRTNWSIDKRVDKNDLRDTPDEIEDIRIEFSDVPESMNTDKELSKISKEFENWIYQNLKLVTYEHKPLKLTMSPNESTEAFLGRVQLAAKESRDRELEELKEKYESKFDRLEDKIRKEEYDIAEAEADVKDRRNSELISAAETIFSVFVKGRSRSFSSNATKRRMSRKASQRLEESKEDMAELQEDLRELEKDFNEKLEAIKAEWDSASKDINSVEINPRKTDIIIENILIAWSPDWTSDKGNSVSARKS